ncbi:hypothetical protein SAMN02983003_1245 [Devosia enhydra]|uniref:Hpt domain-containing protein n=1 Tax=Devosia enhydra TaxID=665118 RepID=A0A1K2HVF7_9HYPH|nr:hypothetical protein [Devosia enhydra]SFZ82732.1 hypothetical protein SAMN02983003_1245 [Devosia enhydra]
MDRFKSVAVPSAQIAPQDAAKTRPRRADPLDLEFLDRQSLGDPGLMDEILRQFKDRLTLYFSRVTASTDVEGLAVDLKMLGLAARGVGAWTIGELSAGAEAELRDSGVVNPERIEDLALAVAEAETWLSERISRMPD